MRSAARTAGLVLLAWPALFISLGWNFLEFALFPPPPDTGIELGWLIPGVLFVIMGAVPLVGFLPGGKSRSACATAFGTTAEPYDFEKDSEARYADELRHGRAKLLADLVEKIEQSSAGESATEPTFTHNEGDDLVSKLERLSALYRAGSLSYDEFQRAKQATDQGGRRVTARSGPPGARLMTVLIAIAIVLGVAFGYWVFTGLT